MQIRSWHAGGAALIALCCSAAAPARADAGSGRTGVRSNGRPMTRV
ncbi:MAG: hypothetical protein ACK5YV_03040 [Betaproteobacteria bacterium]